VPETVKVASADFLGHLSFGSTPDFQDKAVRIRCGSDQDYVDTGGFRWNSDRYFAGGTEFHRAAAPIFRSPDPALYSSGRQGVFHYDIPVAPGVYEVHLLFAETAPDIQDGMRQTSFIVGAGYSDTVDVVADAGGPNVATMKIYPMCIPERMGKFTSILVDECLSQRPGDSSQAEGKPGPVRISALPTLYTDLAGRHWLPDRYFLGGRILIMNFL